MPTIEEWLAVAKGCDGTTNQGTPQGADFQSTCEWTGDTFIDCQSCPYDEGPGGNGCYWPPEMGGCLSEQPYDYWSSTVDPLNLYFTPKSNYAYFRGPTDLLPVRCATDKP